MKKNLALFMMLLAAVAMTGCSSSDEKEPQIVICFIQPEIIGKWQLVEVKDGPHEFHQNGYEDAFKGAFVDFSPTGKVTMTFSNYHTEKMDWRNDKNTIDDLPVVYIENVPFTYTIEGLELKLHYKGIYKTDHIPATFVLQQISDDEYNDIMFNWSYPNAVFYPLQIKSDDSEEDCQLFNAHCYKLRENLVGNDGTTIHRKTNLEFGALIKDSSVFDMLGFCFDGESPVKEFSDMQIGAAYDASQFNACAYFRSTDGLEVLRGSRCVSGQIEVIDKKELGEDSVITLKFNGLVFPSKDGTSTYTFNSTVDYKIQEIQYAEDL